MKNAVALVFFASVLALACQTIQEKDFYKQSMENYQCVFSKLNEIEIKLKDQQVEITYLRDFLDKKMLLKNLPHHKFTLTGYSATKEECDGDPSRTATMTKPVPGRTVAVSRDHLELLGKVIYIQGLGTYYVEDKTSVRLKDTIDVLFSSKKEALDFGKKTGEVVVISDN